MGGGGGWVGGWRRGMGGWVEEGMGGWVKEEDGWVGGGGG